MKKLILVLSVGFSLLGFTIMSCQKTNPGGALEADAITIATTSVTNAHSANDVTGSIESNLTRAASPASQFISRKNQLQVDNGVSSSAGALTPVHFIGAFGDSVTIIPQGLNSPGIMTSDFGTGVTVAGKLRKGSIISHYIDKYYEYGFSDTITFNKYSENGKAISGSIVLTRTSDTSFTRVCLLSFSQDGGIATTYQAIALRNYSFSVSSPGFIIPPVYTISETGVSVSQVGSTGSRDTTTVTTPLQYLYSADCAITAGVFPIKGSATLTSSALTLPQFVDFGNGSCDLTFTLTTGGVVKTVTLSSTSN